MHAPMPAISAPGRPSERAARERSHARVKAVLQTALAGDRSSSAKEREEKRGNGRSRRNRVLSTTDADVARVMKMAGTAASAPLTTCR